MHAAQHRAAEPPRADGVVDDAHFESRTGFAYQDFGDGASDAVVADDVVLHVDRPHGPLERGDQRREGVVAVVEQFDAVVAGDACAAAPCDDLSETVAAVCAAFRRREVRPVTSQYVEQRAGYGEQQDQRQPRRSRRGQTFLSGDERNGSERPCDVNCKQQIHNPCVRAYSVPCRLKKDLEIRNILPIFAV